MSNRSRSVLREFRGRLSEGDILAVLGCHFDESPVRVWQLLSSPTLPLRIPIADGEGVGSTYTSDAATGSVTACDAPTTFRLSLTYRECRADCTFILTSAPDGGTSCRIESRFIAPPQMWHLAVTEAVYAMLQWELLLRQMAPGAGETPREEPFVFAGWVDSAEGKAALVHVIETWWRATIHAGLDEGFVAQESNHVTRQILDRRDERHPQVAALSELRTKGAVRPYVDSTTHAVQVERDRNVTRLLAQVSDIIRASCASRGEELGPAEWELDSRRYLPFRWIVDDKSVARFFGSPQVPYRVVEVIEYQLARARFGRRTLGGVAMANLEIELPIRQAGRVIRDEGAGLDRVDISWSVPREMVELVDVDSTAPPVESILRATDEGAKVVVTSHLGLDDAVYRSVVQPDAVREYAIPPNRGE